MSYIRGEDREQASFLPARIDDYVGAEAAVQVIDAFAEDLDVVGLGFVRAVPAATGRPGYDPRKRDPRSPESLVSAQPAGVGLLEPSRRNLVISGAFRRTRGRSTPPAFCECPPSWSRASAHSRASACGPHGGKDERPHPLCMYPTQAALPLERSHAPRMPEFMLSQPSG